MVKPGGRIAYVTCSVLAEENGHQVRGFLARYGEFRLLPPAEVANGLGERAFLFRHAVLVAEEGPPDDAAADRHRRVFSYR